MYLLFITNVKNQQRKFIGYRKYVQVIEFQITLQIMQYINNHNIIYPSSNILISPGKEYFQHFQPPFLRRKDPC